MNRWKSETVYHSGDQFFSDLLSAIDKAQQSVLIETYIFAKDRLGTDILKHLAAAAKRGCEVKVLIDGVGSMDWNIFDLESAETHGIEVRIFHPLPWQSTGGISQFVWSKVNTRNHRKTAIIDSQLAFAGGLNISDFHLESRQGRNAWRDTGVSVTGKSISALLKVFWADWRSSGKIKLKSMPHYPLVVVNSTARQKIAAHKQFIGHVANAQKRVWISTPYFFPDLRLIQSLNHCARRGIDVRLLLPRKNDVFFMKWVNRSFYRRLNRSGVKIYEYVPSTLHAKVRLIDQWCTVGSSNVNGRSLLRDLETDIVLVSEKSINLIAEQFEVDCMNSVEMDFLSENYGHFWKNLFDKLLFIFKGWF